jgi:hypothetical protein
MASVVPGSLGYGGKITLGTKSCERPRVGYATKVSAKSIGLPRQFASYRTEPALLAGLRADLFQRLLQRYLVAHIEASF